jgi:cyclic pyranopterin phosphate synthase
VALFKRSRPRRRTTASGHPARSQDPVVEAALTHVDAEGAARMVDVGAKPATFRTALATGTVRTTTEVITLLGRRELAKGDALATARIAAIMGAKRTAELIPLCHPIALTAVTVDLELNSSTVDIRVEAQAAGPTGVEMEALTAVAIAGLTLHDMIKAVDPAAELTAVTLQSKQGGKSGHWIRPIDRGPVPTINENATIRAGQ